MFLFLSGSCKGGKKIPKRIKPHQPPMREGSDIPPKIRLSFIKVKQWKWLLSVHATLCTLFWGGCSCDASFIPFRHNTSQVYVILAC